MEKPFNINSMQAEILNMMSFVKDENTFIMLKKVISDFFAKKADEELNRLWENGSLDNDKIENFKYLHQRTAYK